MREFRVPGLILTGSGSSLGIGRILRMRGVRHAFVVSDWFILATAGAREVLAAIADAGVQVTTHDRVTGEPTMEMVERAHRDCATAGADAVIGLGGGSAMDVAKAVAILMAHDGPLTRFEGAEKVPGGRVPLACIATTAGTGSEVTRFVIVTDEARDRKMLISSWEAMPDIAVADPDLTRDVPSRPMVAAGIDALTHAIESYVSRRSQPMTDPLALSAIARLSRALPRVLANPRDDEARAEMSVGALEAGIAFSNASVALVHGMARPLGAYFAVPHGMANAVLLPAVCEFSRRDATDRYSRIGTAMGVGDGSGDGRDTVTAIADLCRSVGVPTLSDLGVARDAYDLVLGAMASDAIASGSPANNPRIATEAEIVDLYRAVWA